jgi:hypothetical protein
MDIGPANSPQPGEAAEIEAAGRDAGIVPGDPAYPFVRGLVRMLLALARRLDAHEEASRGMASTVAAQATPLLSKSFDQAARARNDYLNERAAEDYRKWLLKWWGIGSLAAAVMIAVAFFGGRWWADELAHARIAGIDGAAFMTQLAEVNDTAALRQYCEQHVTQNEAGWVRCSLPDVWVRVPTGVQPKRAAAK